MAVWRSGVRETTLQKLRHAVTLSDAGSYSIAAAQLGMSQPALTRSIQSLEREIGIMLFDRSRSGLRITEAGDSYLKSAVTLLSESRSLSALAVELATGSTGEIAFGLAPIPARILLPDLALQILHDRPGVSLDISVQTAARLLDDLVDERISFFISSASLVENDVPVDRYPVATVMTALIVRSDHPLARRDHGSSEDVLSYPIISQSLNDPRVRSLVAQASSLIHCDDVVTIKAIIAASDAIWLATPHVAVEEIAKGDLVELSNAFTAGMSSFSLELYRLRRRQPSKLSAHVEMLVRAMLRKKLRGGGL